ncbi:MAG: NAD-dependent epimerase [Steroidobacteraceae bacterium]
MKVLVTGAAGFIGSFAAQRFLARGDEVVGLDNLNDYYDVNLKRARLARLEKHAAFRFVKLDLAEQGGMAALFAREKFQRVVHLGAQAGVRHSLKDPHSYIHSNVVGTLNVLEGCRHTGVQHLVYASTSSVYGASTKMPFSTHEPASHPLSLYAASKRATELMAHNYSALFGVPTTGLRFFTVYGPWGRPDMALFLFTRAILEGKPIEVFNNGHHKRDFTYVEDIVEGIVRASDRIAAPDPKWDSANPDPSSGRYPYRLYNIGSNRPVELLRYIEVLEQCLGRKAEMQMKPLQPGDVPDTYADVDDLVADVGYKPDTPIEVGVRNFVDWYLEFYGQKKRG